MLGKYVQGPGAGKLRQIFLCEGLQGVDDIICSQCEKPIKVGQYYSRVAGFPSCLLCNPAHKVTSSSDLRTDPLVQPPWMDAMFGIAKKNEQERNTDPIPPIPAMPLNLEEYKKILLGGSDELNDLKRRIALQNFLASASNDGRTPQNIKAFRMPSTLEKDVSEIDTIIMPIITIEKR